MQLSPTSRLNSYPPSRGVAFAVGSVTTYLVLAALLLDQLLR
ncbi:MAG TPA: hypothetical protein VJ673_04530 [Aromatoleum sp.]|nr:hypothetical protein [Aromatoleum sp.]HJV24927.1 hypothetical protein [Aromatoleum sp.]